MESNCNKEEAIRAKEIAEEKMKNKDFVGARKLIQKAEQLFPDLENISLMLSVCDVHCSADHKVFGSDMDWYGILQIVQTAEEASITKNYRKLARLLHPDKNKFPGAEAAFQMIGKAKSFLLNSGNRSVYDMKYSSFMRIMISHPSDSFMQGVRWGGNITRSSYFGMGVVPAVPRQLESFLVICQ